MMDFFIYVSAFVVALGILITVHEFGHFLVARLAGVKVLRFSVGFGKPLWMRRIGKDEMELVIGAFPLGGYVKMLDEAEAKVSPQEIHRAFNRQKLWKRMAIVMAGPMFNFLFAIFAYWMVYSIGIDGIKPEVSKVIDGSLAQQAGFRAGDVIQSVDGKEVQSWDHRRLYLFQRALDNALVGFEVRDVQGNDKSLKLDLSELPVEEVNAAFLERGIGLVGFVPEPLPVIGAMEPGPAARAGLKVGDRLLAVNHQPVESWENLVALISQSPGTLIHILAERDGKRLDFEVTPDAVSLGEKTIGRINIRPLFSGIPDEAKVRVHFGIGKALAEGIGTTWAMSVLTLEMLYRMLKFEVSARNISGPITIAQYAGHSAKMGFEQFVLFLGIISISLGVLNLLPIPVLDGGHLMYYIIEAVKGSPVSERFMVVGQQIGVTMLIGLMVLAFYNDLTRIFL